MHFDFDIQEAGRTEQLVLSPWSTERVGFPRVSAPTPPPFLARIPMAAPPSPPRTLQKPIWGHAPCIPTPTHHQSLPPLAMGPAASSGLLATRHPAVSLLSTSGLFQLGPSHPGRRLLACPSHGGHCTHRGQMEAKQGSGANLHGPHAGLLQASTSGAWALAVATFS